MIEIFIFIFFVFLLILKNYEKILNEISQDKEHVSFPLQPERVDNDKKTLAETFTPENDMEKEIQMVLRQSGLSKEKELEKDDLGIQKILRKID